MKVGFFMNSPVKTIMLTLSDAGLTATLIPPANISISPGYRLTDELRTMIRSHKQEIIHELEAANQPDIRSGTRRSPDASPFLVESSKAYDRQLLAAGYSLEIPPEPAQEPIQSQDNIIKDNPPPREKILDHFNVDSPWRVLSKAYYQHHFNCQWCICAGRGARYGKRCDVGAQLWQNYAERDKT